MKTWKNPRLYRIWKGMRSRCNTPTHRDYRYYGGRGIKVCASWDDFYEFQRWAYEHGYNDSLTIDRTNCCGNYEPGNCRWITQHEQNRNKRKQKNYTFSGITMCQAAWAQYLDINPSVLYDRIRRHGPAWALSTPKWAGRKPAENCHKKGIR